jgi:hypothetical protein
MKRAALFLLCLSFAVVASRAQTTPNKKLSGNRCNDGMFAPNYAAKVGVFKSVRWESFPITVWIDPSTVRDAEEMADLQAGLSAWSTATHGVLGVTFVQKEQGTQISVRMVDTLDGANGLTRYTVIDRGFLRRATIQIVHSPWLGSQFVQYRPRTVQRDAAHEMGHALGIPRHTTRPGTIMLPIAAVDVPAPLDVNTIEAKYCELF